MDITLEDDDETRPRDGGNGRETEDEMRKRILEELEVERSALEKELREIKEKEEKLAGEYLTSAQAPLVKQHVPRLDLLIDLSSPSPKAVLTPCADLSNEQRQAIFAAPDFTSFIEESTKIVQRALSDGYDYIRDYTVGLEGAL